MNERANAAETKDAGETAMAPNKRPRRQKKADRLTYSGADKSEIECDYAIGPMDRLAIEMDKKWGIDRLPELVSCQTAQKYGAAMAKLNAALDSKDPAEAVQRANVCIRGMRAMDAEAEAAGYKPNPGTFWEIDVDGFRIGIMQDGGAWQTTQAQRPDLTLYSLREVAMAIKAYSDAVPLEAAKKLFPGAEVVAFPATSKASPHAETLEDEIPW